MAHSYHDADLDRTMRRFGFWINTLIVILSLMLAFQFVKEIVQASQIICIKDVAKCEANVAKWKEQ